MSYVETYVETVDKARCLKRETYENIETIARFLGFSLRLDIWDGPGRFPHWQIGFYKKQWIFFKEFVVILEWEVHDVQRSARDPYFFRPFIIGYPEICIKDKRYLKTAVEIEKLLIKLSADLEKLHKKLKKSRCNV